MLAQYCWIELCLLFDNMHISRIRTHANQDLILIKITKHFKIRSRQNSWPLILVSDSRFPTSDFHVVELWLWLWWCHPLGGSAARGRWRAGVAGSTCCADAFPAAAAASRPFRVPPPSSLDTTHAPIPLFCRRFDAAPLQLLD